MRRADLTDEAFRGATSAWREPGQAPKTERIALYRSRFLDAFTKTPPWLPYVLVTPVIVLSLVGVGSEPPLVVVGLLVLGALSWTLVEYLMHRFLFHARVSSETGRIVTFLAHGHHHVYPDDPRRIAATPVQLVSLMLLFWGVFQLVLRERASFAMAGALAAYLAYELVHWSAHHGRSSSRVLRALRRHHLAHHHRDPRSRWGIGSPLWDVVFRTMPTTGPGVPTSGSDDGRVPPRDESSAP